MRTLFVFVLSIVVASFALDINSFANGSTISDPLMQFSSGYQLQPSKTSVGGIVTGGENSVNPNLYIVGPGDEFEINIPSSSLGNLSGFINADNDLFIVSFGIIKVGRVPLIEAKEIIRKAIAQRLKSKSDCIVSLKQAKAVSFTINGSVKNPGTYLFSGTYRLLDAVKVSFEGILPNYNENNFREIQIRNNDEIKTFDLLKYQYLDMQEENPYIYPGDNLFIPAAKNKVLVNGPTATLNGWIPIKEGENIRDFLPILNCDLSADLSNVLIQTGQSKELRETICVNMSKNESYILKDRDVITITSKKNYAPDLYVVVQGEVARPGRFPLQENETTVHGLLEIAGGINHDGDEARLVVLRKKTGGLSNEKEAALIQNSTLSTIRPEIQSALKKMFLLNDWSVLNLIDRSGYKLLPGDVLFVPRKDDCVYVSGNVKMPGAYPVSEGKKSVYYVKKAGGYSKRADARNVFALRTYGDIVQVVDGSNVLQGDIICVPESQQAKMLNQIIIPVIGVIMGIISLVTLN